MVAANRTLLETSGSVLRGRLHFCGRISAVFIAAALFCLADGLYAVIRMGSDVLELLPGQTLMVSGPSPLKNPQDGDITAQFSPSDDGLFFATEAYFASYWLGSAMWRGAVRADIAVRPGNRELTIRFRGIPARGAQKFTVVVWENEEAQRAGDPSIIRRNTGVGPEWPGLACGVGGLLLGALTFLWGRRYIGVLSGIGCSEIFRVAVAGEECRIFCLANGLPVPREGSACRVFTPAGQELEGAVMQKAAKGILEFSIPKSVPVSRGCLVELRRRLK
ncbi:MAG: hypothetical protein LBC94_08355 [Desulfovibrio sp.]|jgi:hypothetical protein|nr:hypothetical protein [Desulfovibrio sp.]